MAQETFDYVVVGAGSAGCVLANRLTASGRHRVLLVEAGGSDQHFWVSIPLGMSRLMANPALAWLDRTVPTESFGGRSLVLTQGKMLGGTSSLNGMIFVRGNRHDYDGWAAEGCRGWSWDDVLPYYRKLECLEEGGRDEHHGRSGELKLSWIKDIHPISREFLQAAKDAGIPFNEDTNSGDQEGIGYIQGTIYEGKRQSTSATFLKAARGRPNLVISTGAHVQRIVFEDGRAVGVELRRSDGTTETKRCSREVIVSAGAIGSPQILQHSGIGDGEHLRSLGIDVVHHSPEVGRNLQDHLFGHIKYRLAKPSDSINRRFTSAPSMALALLRWMLFGTGAMNTTSAQLIGFLRSDASPSRPDWQLAMRPFSFHIDGNGDVAIDPFPGMTVSAINVQPFSRGEVKIQSADSAERTEIDINYLSDTRDTEVLTQGIQRLREVMKQPVIARHVVEEVEPGPQATTKEALGAYLRQAASTVYHPVGTCRMGSDDGAVLDPCLRLRGVDGLRVIDASVMPKIISGNTNAPSIMIGEKGADLVLADAR